jgi:prepilin-type N-terminal cleavage/methylation domain-containing protein
MKRPFPHRTRSVAFTLVELLVVIGIIAILASVVAVSAGSAIRAAKRAQANAEASQIQTAVLSYYTEYGVYPVSAADAAVPGDVYYNGTDVARWENLMWALCGNINPYSPQTAVTPTVPNSRAIAYLAPTRSTIDANGIFTNPFGTSGTSTYFYMAIDTDYSGVVGDSTPAKGKMPDFTMYPTNYTGVMLQDGTPGGVAVWCPCDQPLGGGTASKASPANFWAHTY